MNKIILYSTGCPKCKVLKQKLDNKGVAYTENNSVEDMQKLGIDEVPVLSIDGVLNKFSDANKWINEQ